MHLHSQSNEVDIFSNLKHAGVLWCLCLLSHDLLFESDEGNFIRSEIVSHFRLRLVIIFGGTAFGKLSSNGVSGSYR